MKRLLILSIMLSVPVILSAREIVRLTRFEGRRITGVSASSGFDVYLVRSNEAKAVAEIDAELEGRLILTLNDDGIVKVGLASSRVSPRLRDAVLKVTVYLPELTYLEGSGGVDIHPSGSFSTDSAVIVLSGAGELNELEIRAKSLKLTCSGAAEASIRGEAGNLDMRASGASDVELDLSCGTAVIHCSGASDAKLRGAADQAEMTISGGSDLDASKFAVRRLVVTSSGASEALVWATEKLDANASSASSVRYIGSPSVFNTKSSSAGSVRRTE